MIGKVAPKRRDGHSSFIDLRRYLEYERDGTARKDLLATWSGNVAAHATADIEMHHISQRGKTDEPVYHLILSWRPHEVVSESVVRDAVDVTMRSLNAEDQQWFAAVHVDEKDQRTHLHLVINRTHPVTYKTLDRWQEKFKLARATEYIEAEHGCLVDRRMAWRERLPELDLGITHDQAHEQILRSLPDIVRAAPRDALQNEMDKAHRAGYSWVTLLQGHVMPAVLQQVEQPHATWHDVHATLETYGLHFERAGSGLRIVGSEIGQRARASRVGIDFATLETKLGPYQACRVELTPLHDNLPELKRILREETSWSDVHTALLSKGLALEQRGLGGRILDLQDGQQSIPLGRLGTSMPRLRARLGDYEMPTVLEERQQRENARADAAVSQRIVAVEQDPRILIDRVSAHNSVWTQADIEYELGRVVGVDRPTLMLYHGKEINNAVQAVMRASIELGSVQIPALKPDEKPKLVSYMSIPEIIDAERDALDAFAVAHHRNRSHLHLREASNELDEQQQAAFRYMADGTSDVRIVTGIAGAGKSRLLRDVSAAYAEAGYTVIGSAVAGDAARTLGEEAEIAAMTTTRLLNDVEKGRLVLTPMTVVLLDEATQLGTTDGLRLAQALNVAGARLIATGDLAQHESVARGPILSELAEGIEVADLSETRRANSEWLRSVGKDMREGRTTRALDTMREHGAIGEYETRSDAMRVLVDRYVADIRAGRTAVMVATTRQAVHELNVLAREAMGDALGERREYSTAFGQRDFAVGDQVVTRRGVRDVLTLEKQPMHVVNGEQWVVAGHRDDGRLELRHTRSGAHVAWNIAEYPEVDWSMATTSYRSQGRTVDSAYALVTESDARRGLYVDITRAREDVFVVYAREDLTNFGEFLAVGGRERAKMTVAAAQRYIREHRTLTEDFAAHDLQNGIIEERVAQASTATERLDLENNHRNIPQVVLNEVPEHNVSREPMTYEEIEADALQQVANPQRLAELVREYRARFGNIIDPDNARELFPAYAQADNETRARITPAVHEASSTIARAVWGQLLREPVELANSNQILVLAGGSGSGKQSTLQQYIANSKRSFIKVPHAIWDTTLSSYDSAKQRIEEALTSGKNVTILYVHRPIELAAKGIVERENDTGRSVPEGFIAASHYGAQHSIFKLEQYFEHDPRVVIRSVDNSGAREDVALGNLETIVAPVRYTSEEEVQIRLRKAMQDARDQSGVAERVQRATQERSGRTRASSGSESQRGNLGESGSPQEASESESKARLDHDQLAVSAGIEPPAATIENGISAAHPTLPWGDHGSAESFARAVFVSPIGHAWKVSSDASGVVLEKRGVFIRDNGRHISTSEPTADSAIAMTMMASLKTWTALEVVGDDAFRAEIARHAPQYRITIATSVSPQQQMQVDDGGHVQQAVVQQRSGPIIIETNSAHELWGGFETTQAYAKALFAGPIGHSWKVEVVEAGVRLFNSYAEILDRGLRLEVTTSGTEEITMQTIADLARLKKWDTITVSGNETHLLRVVRAAQQQHLHVESKTHSAEQIHTLQQQEQAQRRKGWSR